MSKNDNYDEDDLSLLEVISNNLRRFSKKDKNFLIALTLIVVIAATIIVGVDFAYDGVEGGIRAISAYLLTVIVGVWVAILDRINVAAPISRKLEAIIVKSEDLNGKLIHLVEQHEDYYRFNNAHNRFGIFDVKGDLEVGVNENDEEDITIKRDTDEFAIRIFEEARPGCVIRYMNTYLENSPKYYDAIKKALKSGVNIKLLLLNPDPNCPAFETRYTDCLQFIYLGEEKLEIAKTIRQSTQRFIALSREVGPSNVDRGNGKLEVRFYEKSLNFPMILMSANQHEKTPPTVAYTGFYGKISSEAMPYIEWREAIFPALSRFKDIFDNKWQESQGVTFIDL